MTSTADALQNALDALAIRPLRNAVGAVVNVLQENGILRAGPTPGRLVVAPGQVISSGWGNTVFDQSIIRFANAADRDNQWPSPGDGAMCFTADNRIFWRRANGIWVNATSTHARVGSVIAGTYDVNKPARIFSFNASGTTNATGYITASFATVGLTGVTAVIALFVTVQADDTRIALISVNNQTTTQAVIRFILNSAALANAGASYFLQVVYQ